VRTLDEIQRAHDILWAVVMGEVRVGIDQAAMAPWHASLDTLCWALGPDHNDQSTAFRDNLAKLERAIAVAGYELAER